MVTSWAQAEESVSGDTSISKMGPSNDIVSVNDEDIGYITADPWGCTSRGTVGGARSDVKLELKMLANKDRNDGDKRETVCLHHHFIVGGPCGAAS